MTGNCKFENEHRIFEDIWKTEFNSIFAHDAICLIYRKTINIT